MTRVGQLSFVMLVWAHSGPAQTPGSASRCDPEVSRDLRITVHVYNALHLSAAELRRAEAKAEQIFQYARIRITWATGLLRGDVTDDTPGEAWDPGALEVRIWSRAMAGKTYSQAETLGFCLSYEDGKVVVLADAIPTPTPSEPTDPADFLGLAISHELGHALLRSASHSVTGIMRWRWLPGDLREADRGCLRFTPREAEAMRQEVRRRMDAHSHAACADPIFGARRAQPGPP